MTPSARVQTAIEILDQIIEAARSNGAAADRIIADAFKARRYAGSSDKSAIREIVYQVIRHYGTPPPSGRAGVLGLRPEWVDYFDGSSYGPAAVSSDETGAPKTDLLHWLADQIEPEERLALAARAPLDLRVNSLRAERPEVERALPSAAPMGRNGLRLEENLNVEQTEVWHKGWIDIQDYGSQVIAEACAPLPGQLIIDLCAGAGGKSLALAAVMQNQGRIIACDIDRKRLSRLPARAQRLGASMIETRLLDAGRERNSLTDLVEAADIVLVDAPCSGTGTWRRNPEARWRLTPQRLQNVISMQKQVLKLGAELVRPGGVLVYAVCSVLKAEGPAQCDNFLRENSDWTSAPVAADIGRPQGHGLSLSPARDNTDGFFVARLARRA